jgi:hypothetical protein
MGQIAYGVMDCCWMITIVLLGAILTIFIGA